MSRVFIGMGSNIAPEASIKAAMRLLAEKTRLLDVSTFYRTPAEGRPEQPDYINGVVAIETSLPPETLKHNVLRPIESRLGRRRNGDKFAARTIDLDIILYDSATAQTACAPIASKDIETRSFVAIPLAEIAPDLIIPGTGLRAWQLALRFSPSQMVPLGLTHELRREWRIFEGRQ